MELDNDSCEIKKQQTETEEEEDSFHSAQYFSNTSNTQSHSKGLSPDMLDDVVDLNFEEYSNTILRQEYEIQDQRCCWQVMDD